MNEQKLKSAGINYAEGLDRFCGREDIYKKYLLKLLESDYMDRLSNAIREKKLEEAFRISHDIKGTSGNLSLTYFYHSICMLVEALRNGQPDEQITLLYEKARKDYDSAVAAVQEE